MTKAVLGVGFDGDEAESGLDKIDKKLGDVDKTAQSLSARFKALQSLWKDPVGAGGKWDWSERMGASVAKASVDIIRGQVGAAADAVIAPAKTSYAGAIAVANSYRDTTQRIATSTGRNYFEISAQIDSSAKRLGILPQRVQAYASSVADLTGDWQSAIDGIDAYQNHALKTNRSLEQYTAIQAELQNVFGVTGTAAAKFWGGIEKQAAAARVDTKKTEQVFLDLAGTFGQLSSADPSKLTALSAGLLQGANGNVGRAERRGAGMMGFLDQHGWWFEQQAKRQGKLKKGESFFDEQGLIKDPNQMIEFAQAEARRVSKGKVTGDVVNYLTAIQGMPREVAAGLMNYKPASTRALEGATGAAADVLTGWMGSGAGGRTGSEVSKYLADQRFGQTFLGAQDTAVSASGGAAGVAFAASGEVFNKATGVFSDAVSIFANAVGKGGGAGAGGSAGGAVAGTALGAVGRGAAGLANIALRAPVGAAGTAGLMAGALFLEGDTAKPAEIAAEGEVNRLQGMVDKREKGGGGRWHFGDWTGFSSTETMKEDLAKAKASLAAIHQGGIDAAGADLIGAAVAKNLQGTTLRTQSIQPATAPPGQGQPS